MLTDPPLQEYMLPPFKKSQNHCLKTDKFQSGKDIIQMLIHYIVTLWPNLTETAPNVMVYFQEADFVIVRLLQLMRKHKIRQEIGQNSFPEAVRT